MFFHGLPASAMYYRTQRISALYWRGMKIWQANAESGPLRKGSLRIHGSAGEFVGIAPILNKGQLTLVRKTASFRFKSSLAKGSLTIHGQALVFSPHAVILPKGQLALTRSTANFRFTATLARGNLHITGSAGTFSLITTTTGTPIGLLLSITR